MAKPSCKLQRLKKIGLTEAYQNEETTQAVFRCLLALPLLPVTDIDPAFQDVKVLVHDDTPSKNTAVATVSLRRASVAQVIHWRGTNVRPRQSRTH